MIHATVNREHNVLHVSFMDRVERRQFEKFRRGLPSVFRCLRADFTLLTDLSGVEEIEFSCVTPIADLMELIVEMGVGQVIRVVPDSSKDIGFAILAAFHYPSMIPIRVFADLEEAKQYMEVGSSHTYEIREEESCEDYIAAGFSNKPASSGV